MTIPTLRTALLLTLCIGLLSDTLLFSQNEIIENPQGAVKLRRIWYKLGGNHIPLVGTGAGPLGDINDDGFDDFAVRIGTEWQVFLGGDPAPQNEPVWIFDSANYIAMKTPVIGDFLGNGQMMIGLDSSHCDDRLFCRITLKFHVSDDNDILRPTDYALTTDNQQFCNAAGILACDLDRDGDDELIVASWCYYPRILIYEGGPGFDLSTPAMIIVDSSRPDLTGAPMSIGVGDIDGDQYPDIVVGQYNAPGHGIDPELRFWWGDEESPWNWENSPDRTLNLSPGTITPRYDLVSQFRDYDGDSLPDFTGTVYLGDSASIYIWRSRSGRSARSRPFDGSDFDHFFFGFSSAGSFGYVGDSTRRYQMLALRPDSDPNNAYGFAGGEYGPNNTFDALFGGGEGPSGGGQSAGDVNGDGWEDRILASETYGGPGVGTAVIITGGPYIPNDDPTVSVRSEPIAGDPAGLFLWPNPVRDELHIAWKGNLKRTPVRFAVYSSDGREIVSGPVDPHRGSALWTCASVPPGGYVVTMYDYSGAVIGTAPIIKP